MSLHTNIKSAFSHGLCTGNLDQWAVVFFISYLIVVSIIFVNIVLAVLVDEFIKTVSYPYPRISLPRSNSASIHEHACIMSLNVSICHFQMCKYIQKRFYVQSNDVVIYLQVTEEKINDAKIDEARRIESEYGPKKHVAVLEPLISSLANTDSLDEVSAYMILSKRTYASCCQCAHTEHNFAVNRNSSMSPTHLTQSIPNLPRLFHFSSCKTKFQMSSPSLIEASVVSSHFIRWW